MDDFHAKPVSCLWEYGVYDSSEYLLGRGTIASVYLGQYISDVSKNSKISIRTTEFAVKVKYPIMRIC